MISANGPFRLLFLFVLLFGASATPTVPAELAECVRFYGSACSEALGAWLPHFVESGYAWEAGRATHIEKRDAFVYGSYVAPANVPLGYVRPYDGTFFVYGNAGPPKGHVVFDYAHHIAFYSQGCCSGNDVVAVVGVADPPKRVVARDLSGLRTVRGVRLGMSPAGVMSIYGASHLLRVPNHGDLRLLAYTTWPPFHAVPSRDPCGQFQNFVFRYDRLISLQIGNGC